MNYYYTDQNGNAAGPISLEMLQSLVRAGSLPPNSQFCPEGSNDWHPASELGVTRKTKAGRVAMPASGRHSHNVALYIAIAALLVSAATAVKVFFPRLMSAHYSFKSPQDAITSYITLATKGSWEDIRSIQIQESESEGKWDWHGLSPQNVELRKTIEVKGSGDETKNGRIICFLQLKCPDGVTRYETVVLEKDKTGDFLESNYPGYISTDKATDEDARLVNLIRSHLINSSCTQHIVV